MRSVEIELRSEWDAEFDAFLAERIYEFNSQATGLSDGRAIVGRVRNTGGQIVAGITGHTWGGTCQVTYLWVHELHRRQGLGRSLLDTVETEAGRRACTQIVLLTHSFQAAGFYETLGYRKQGAVANYPAGHAQLLYVKQLGAGRGA